MSPAAAAPVAPNTTKSRKGFFSLDLLDNRYPARHGIRVLAILIEEVPSPDCGEIHEEPHHELWSPPAVLAASLREDSGGLTIGELTCS